MICWPIIKAPTQKEGSYITAAAICSKCLLALWLQTIPEPQDSFPTVLFRNIRVEQFPSAALTDKSGKKISYSDFISSFENKDCSDALVRLMPRIDLDKINRIIDDIDVISDLRKTFYKTILKERYDKILLAPFLTIKII